jgi:hypothetical protein
VIEKRMFSPGRGPAAGDQFGSKKDGETEKKHGEFVERMVARGYTERQVRRLVEWYMRVKQGRLRRKNTSMPMHIVDRRLNPGSKSLENRQRFLRRAKALVQGAVKKVLPGAATSRSPGRRRGQHPARRHERAALPPRGRHRDMVLPGNKKFIEGDILPRSGGAAARARPIRARATARMRSASC